MTRRAKLSLSPEASVVKRPPSAFGEAAAENSFQAEPAYTPPPRPTEPRKRPQQAESAKAWPDAVKIAKVVLVVGAAALSLYLLRRRLL